MGSVRDLAFYGRNAACVRRPRYGRVAAVGDSITAGTSRADWWLLGRRSWFNQAVASGRIDYGYNAAVPNTYTDQIRDELLPAALHYRPKVVAILAGTGDVQRAERSLAAGVEKIGEMVAASRAAGAVPVVGLVPPLARGPERAIEFNTLLIEAATRWDVAPMDFHAATATDDGLHWKPGLSPDGIHPTVEGAKVMAGVAVPVILSAYAAQSVDYA